MAIYARVSIGDIDVLAFDRHGGKSKPPFDSLNFGSHVGDENDAVLQNWQIITNELGAAGITYLHANHGTTVNLASQFGQAPAGDGLVCKTPKHAIASLSADCVPFALVDPITKVIAVGHAGWKGVLADLMSELAKTFMQAGANVANSVAVIGPSICGKCYEVGQERTALFAQKLPAAIADPTHLQLAAGVAKVLGDLGFAIMQMPGCNYEDENLFSFRRAGGGQTGRGALVAIIN